VKTQVAAYGMTTDIDTEIKKGKPYVFEGKPGDKYGTDQYLSVQHGSARKEYNFNFVSNSGFTEVCFQTISNH